MVLKSLRKLVLSCETGHHEDLHTFETNKQKKQILKQKAEKSLPYLQQGELSLLFLFLICPYTIQSIFCGYFFRLKIDIILYIDFQALGNFFFFMSSKISLFQCLTTYHTEPLTLTDSLVWNLDLGLFQCFSVVNNVAKIPLNMYFLKSYFNISWRFLDMELVNQSTYMF